MLFAIITLFTALSMATVAAWFAIAGIMAVFAGAPIPALIMGAVIELGKLVGVSWIYRHWNEKTKIKFFMLPAVIVAMFLTSMGIFGFLSKAHLEQTTPIGNNTAKIERLDQRIAREQAKIDDANTVIKQLDESVNTLIEYDKISGPDGARAVRAGQQAQRDQLATVIDGAEDKISEFEDEKFKLNSELRKLDLEVGPVKYIAALVYDDPKDNLEKAVRYVICAFIFVFDPMAILLLMGANFALLKRKKDPTAVQQLLSNPLLPDEEEGPSEEDLGGEDLINLIDDDDPEEVVEEDDFIEDEDIGFEEEVVAHVDDNAEQVKHRVDRAWMKTIPDKDEKVDTKLLHNTLKKLEKRDRSQAEQELYERFQKLASRRGLSPEVTSRATVSTQNDLLKT